MHIQARLLILFCVLLITSSTPAQPLWQSFKTASESSLRGIDAVSAQCCWLSGSEGTVLRTNDGGKSWQNVSPGGYDSLQFRDIHAWNDSSALILSAGLPAIILKTTDSGQSWREVYRNESEGVFFDAMDFWDDQRGIAFSDAIGDKLLVIKTQNAGENWQVIDTALLPAVHQNQGGFAASGTCLKTFGNSSVVIGLGGPEATVLLSEDYGQSWIKTTAPLDAGNASSGIFSFDFVDAKNGICVGGNYQADSLTTASAALTNDGGKTWQAIEDTAMSNKYRSCVIYLEKDSILAISRTGCSFSLNGGENWQSCPGRFYSLSTVAGCVWASGPNGKVGRWVFKPL